MKPLSSLSLVAVAILATTACPIGQNDPLPSLGALCIVAEGKCGIEHVCHRDESDPRFPVGGTCMPVTSYGAACNDLEPVTHPPGREGKDDIDSVELVIDAPEDVPLLDDVRSFVGQIRVDADGPPIQLGNLCGFRDLQRVGDGLGIGKTDIVDLNGLQSLTSIEGGLVIYSNPALESLAGLENLVDLTPRTFRGVTFDVAIVGNFSLDADTIDAFVTALEARAGRELAVIACGNQGAANACEGAEQDFAQALAATGFGR